MQLPDMRSRKIQLLALSLVFFMIIGIIIIFQIFQINADDEYIIKAGQSFKQTLSSSEVSYTFQDPLKTPANVPVYPILPAPESLFSEEGVVAIAASIGFTSKASGQQATNGYIYTESGSTLSFDIIGGTLTYSVPKENLPVAASTTISISDAITRAKEFVNRIGFSNPLYTWTEGNVRLYTLDGDTIVDASFVDSKTHFHLPIEMNIGNAPLLLQQEQYIKVHANGDIIGAFLWYPRIDFSKQETVEVIDYADATSEVRIGRSSYIIGKLDAETILNTSTVGYMVPKTFLQSAGQGGFITEPAYVFTNDAVTIYVEAMK